MGAFTSVLLGNWTYRSFSDNPDLNATFDSLEFGRGTIRVDASAMNEFHGLIFGQGWSLSLKGSSNWGNPFEVRFQGTGTIGGEPWAYDYVGYAVRPWPNGVDQRMTMVGSIVRTIPHADGAGGTAPAGVVASWVAVKQDPAP